MKLGDYIKQEGLTPTQWARKYGLSQPVISRFLNNKRGLSLSSAYRIKQITQGAVDLEDLLNNKE